MQQESDAELLEQMIVQENSDDSDMQDSDADEDNAAAEHDGTAVANADIRQQERLLFQALLDHQRRRAGAIFSHASDSSDSDFEKDSDSDAACTSRSKNDQLVDRLCAASRFYGHQQPPRLQAEQVIAAFRAVDRGFFVPLSERDQAYVDRPFRERLGITGAVLHMSAPHMYAQSVESLGILPGDAVLNVGSGTGYLSTVMAFLVGALLPRHAAAAVVSPHHALYSRAAVIT